VRGSIFATFVRHKRMSLIVDYATLPRERGVTRGLLWFSAGNAWQTIKVPIIRVHDLRLFAKHGSGNQAIAKIQVGGRMSGLQQTGARDAARACRVLRGR